MFVDQKLPLEQSLGLKSGFKHLKTIFLGLGLENTYAGNFVRCAAFL